MLTLFGLPAWLLLAFLLIGFGRGSITNFDNRMVNQLSGGSPAAANLLHGSFAVGAIIAPLVFLALRNAISWQAGLGFVIVCGCVCVFAFSRMRLKQDSLDRHNKGNTTWKFLKNPSFLILGGMMFCYLCSEYAINGWLVTYIQHKESLCASLAASGSDPVSFSQAMASLLWVVILIGRLSCAVLSARFPQKKMMLVCSIGMTAFYALMLMSESIGMVTFSIAGLGLCMAGICPMIYSDAAIFTNTYPMATSALLAMGSTGAIIMPALVGALAEVFGFTGGMSAIFVSVALLVVCAVLNVTVKNRMTPEMKKTAQA
ncbi:MAG: MFS transporter, partial [Aristaeellaceae bacterium]